MNGEYKLLWATDVGAQLEAEFIGMEVFASKADASASELVSECGEIPVPIIVFVPRGATEEEVLAAAKGLSTVNDLNLAIRMAELDEDKEA